jgi:hypothetical protein
MGLKEAQARFDAQEPPDDSKFRAAVERQKTHLNTEPLETVLDIMAEYDPRGYEAVTAYIDELAHRMIAAPIEALGE